MTDFCEEYNKNKKHALYTYSIITATWTMTRGHEKLKTEQHLFGLSFPIMNIERKME